MGVPISPRRRRLLSRPAPHVCPNIDLSNYVERGAVGWRTWRRFNPHGSVWRFLLQLVGGYGLTNAETIVLHHERMLDERRCHTWQRMSWCFCEESCLMSDDRCYRPKDHDGACGESIDQDEDDDRILYGRCGAAPAPTTVLYATSSARRKEPDQ